MRQLKSVWLNMHKTPSPTRQWTLFVCLFLLKYESLPSQWNRTLWNVFYGFVAMFTLHARICHFTSTLVRWHFVDIHQTNFTKNIWDTEKKPLLNLSGLTVPWMSINFVDSRQKYGLWKNVHFHRFL